MSRRSRLARLCWGALAPAALGVLAAPAPALGAPGQEPPPSPVRQAPTPPPASQPIPASLGLVDQTTWLERGGRFDVELLVSRPPAGAALQVVAHEPLLSRAAFQESIEGDRGDVVRTGPAQPLASLPGGSAGGGTVTASLETGGSEGQDELDQGVHPVEVRLLDGSGAVVASLVTYAVVVPADLDGFSPLAVSVIVDVAGPPALQPDGSVVTSRNTLDRVEERVEALEDAPRAPLTVAPQPETLDGLADGGGSRGRRLLERLADVSAIRPVLARPYTDVDIAALARAGLVAEVNAQAQGGADVVRARFAREPVPGVWLPPGSVGEEAARLLVDLGVGRAVVAPEAVSDVPGVESGAVPEEPVTLGEGGPVAMVSDPVLAERLAGDDLADAQLFVAELAMAWLERPAIARGVVVRLPADAAVDPDVLARALNELTDSPVLRPMPVTELLDTVSPVEGDAPPLATPAAHQPAADLAGLREPIEAARSEVSGFGSLVQSEEAGRSLQHSLLMATGATVPNAERAAYVTRVTREVTQLADVIHAPDEFRITLTSRSSSIPLNLTNDSGRPVAVRIQFESDQLEFPDGDVITTTLEPGATRVDIAVRTRASGAFPLDIRVTSPDGTIELETTRFDIRSTAVSGVGLVLSLAAGLFLAVWWARHWRSAQRSRRLLPPDEVGDAAVSADTAAGGNDDGAPGASGPPPPPPPAAAAAGPESGEDTSRRRGRYRPAHMAGPGTPEG